MPVWLPSILSPVVPRVRKCLSVVKTVMRTIMLAAAGRKGALSIERFLQRAHMTIGRENDGPYETRLYTNLEGIAPLDRVRPADL